MKIEDLAQSHWFGLMPDNASTPFLIWQQSSTFTQNVYTNITSAEHDYYTFATDFAIYEMLLLDSSVEYLEDGVSKADSTQSYGSNAIPIAFHSWTDGKIEVDWVAVRKYDTGSLSMGFGTEQHQRTIPLILYSSTVLDGWVGTVNGVTNPAKINGIAVANISKVNGVS